MKFGTYINTKRNATITPEYLIATSIFNSATITVPKYGEKIKKDDLMLQWIFKRFKNIRGNALIQFPQSPNSFKNDLSLDEFEQLLKDYIQNVIRSYPQVRYWDIINEVMAESGNLRTKTRFPGGSWAIHPVSIIPNWIEKLFIWAYEANPEAEFYINDYRPQNPVKWNAILSLVDSLRDKSVPIHGIGIQHHHHLPRACFDGLFAWNQTRQVVRKARQKGLKVHFTETSIWNNPAPGNLCVQALAYRQLANCALDEGVDYFNIWSLSDHSKYHWGFSKEDREAGIFDNEFQPKPVYWALKGLMF